MKLRAATRGSDLARWQTAHVADLLTAANPGIEVTPLVVTTAGDRDQQSPLHEIGGKGVFVKEVQAAVLDGRADFAVHSAKDLPAETPDGLVIAAVTERGDPRDTLVGSTLAGLPPGALVGTGSIRRRAQLAALRPDLRFGELRGNIATRLEKAAGFVAVVVAQAALDRLGLAERATEVLGPERMVPQVGQGALAIECREDAPELRRALAAIEDPASRSAVEAERAFLRELGGDCDLPAGAHAVVHEGSVRLLAFLAAPDGRRVLRERRAGSDPDALGVAVARHLLEHGGRELLSP